MIGRMFAVDSIILGGVKLKKLLVVISVVGKLLVLFVVGCMLFVFILSFIFGGGVNRRIGYERMERIFIEDYELLRSVVDYFAGSEHTSIFIRFEEDLMGDISDDNVAIAFDVLRERGYRSMHKVNNIITFLRSTRGRHFGNGIVYSIDGVEPNYGVDTRSPLYGSARMPTQIMYLTRLEPLSKPNWYYYEANFREWRIRYR